MTTIIPRAKRWVGGIALAGTMGSTLLAGGCAGNISTAQEVQLGQQYAAEVEQQLPIVNDQAVNYYINQLGNSIATRVDPRGISYRFRVVNANEVNAFSLPGGFVYVNRGLIERTSNMSELAGVLGHEIGHVVERHSVEQMTRAQDANAIASVLYGVLLGRNPSAVEQVGIQAGGSALFAHYSRDAEREADHDAVNYMVTVGINPNGLITMFEKLLSEEQSEPGAVAGWFATHPLTSERVQNVQQEIAAIPAARRRNLATDTKAFQDFRSRVRSLPRPRQ
jgi:predicted Zn-dependent protease